MKVVLDDTTSGYDLATINANFQKVEDELNNKVYYRDNPAGEPNALSTPLDANSQRIYNLPEPLSPNEAARLQDVKNAVIGPLAANLISFTPGGDISSTNVQSAIVEVYGDLLSKVGRFVDPADYGAVGDGAADDTTALLNSANAAIASNSVWKPRAGKTYKFTKLTLPNNLLIMAEQATLRSDGSLTNPADVSLTIGSGTVADAINLTSPGTETNTDILSIGNSTKIGRLTVSCDTQRAGGGVITEGQDVQIGSCYLTRVDRGFHIYNTNVVTPTNGFFMGYLRVNTYVRAFRATHAYGFVVLHTYATGKSANADILPGHNGVLIVGCSDWYMPTLRLEDSGEHAFRVGGSDGGGVSDNYTVDTLVAVRSGGCALKINPTKTVGITEKSTGWLIGEVLGIDVGNNISGGNKELLRLTHVRKGRIGRAHAIKDSATFSGQYGLIINDADDVEIGSLTGDGFNAGFISLDSTSDISGGTIADNVTNLKIDQLGGSAPGNNAIAIDMNAYTYGNVFIKNINITGFTTYLARVISGTLTGQVLLQGMVTGGVTPIIFGMPTSASFLVDVMHNRSVIAGRADTLRYGLGAWQRTFPVFNPADVAPNGLFLNAAEGTSGIGNYGAAVEWSRVGSSRRGAAAGVVQTGANVQNTGFQISTGQPSAASDQLIPSFRVSHEAAMQIVDGIGAPTTTAGWAQIYVDTADGDLKVKFGDGVVKTLATDT